MTMTSMTGHHMRLTALAMTMLLPSAGTSIANVALPTLAVEFGASSQDVQWVVIAYLLATTTIIVAAGRLGDMLGRRRILLIGIALFGAASAAAALAPSLWPLVAARAAQGLGSAIMMALAVAGVGDLVPKHRAGAAMGLLGSVSAVGTALGPSLGGALIAVSGWQAVFSCLALLAAATLVLGLLAFPRDRHPAGARIELDIPGIGSLAISLGAFALVTTLEVDLQSALLLAAVALVAVIAFVMIERSATAPLVQLGELRNRPLSAGLVAIGLISIIMMSTLVVSPFYLAHVLDLDPFATGLVMSVGPAVAALTGVPAGRVVDRIGGPRVSFIGLGGVIIGAALMVLLPAAAGVPGYIAALSSITAGYALFQSANNTSIMSGAAGDRRGAVSGLLALARNLGLISGASVMGAIFAGTSQLAIAGLPAGAEVGMRMTFLVATLIALAATMVTFWGTRRPVDPTPHS
ncbi:MFS transporter [Devosia sp. PTR5]|uniref:MFS transporter n=1 Tax=Devosia oryzisoli TaxID=2774138 RepID=A0A927IQU1_9HYPH|nr:MFS transporter [Devosia oryzisoli]MBD8066000.1 MFS transporter [Devosia oryzisoli]